MRLTTKKFAALALADTMLATDASLPSLLAACQRVFDASLPWAPALCAALLERTAENFHYFSRYELADLVLQCLARGGDVPDAAAASGDEFAEDAVPAQAIALPAVRRLSVDPPIRPSQPAWLAALALPALPSLAALSAWLNEPVGALDWFADQWRLASEAQSRLQHYHYRWVPKRSGGLRLIEIPKARLRHIQHQILRQILDRVPPHAAAQGFRRGHSCLTHAAQHAGQAVVIRMDLKDFFPSIQVSRVHALFEKLGYPPRVAGTLARICVNRTPRGVFSGKPAAAMPTAPALSWSERQALRSPHLPQGSPCSPALANLCAYRLDIRLASLAESLGASYSRYADDLAFSGGPALARMADRFHVQVAAIALEEGFSVNTRKTRVMREGTRQQVTGIVVNAHPNIARDDYDKLKATLTNCVRHGPASQNRDRHADFRAYLAGKISYVKMVNANRAHKLQRLLDAVAWT